ncbi:class I SAM-dependent methyltransferase [Kribbella sp. NPDC056861]|uniref:class I SAM-dependent methyltransferase n=1 Tax=Kribbella sp. NPDC056861 TaxID=3154857 RepID=UPI00343BEE51
MNLAARLAHANLMYRRPDLYDHLADGGDLIAVVEQLTIGAGLGSVLDLGCGTGRHLAALQDAYGCDGSGVDIQPDLIEYGQAVHPGLDLRVGDMRSARLGRQFDLVLCLGNSLAYQLTDEDLCAAVETLGVHAAPGGFLLIATMLRPPLGTGSIELTNDLVTAEVEVESSWNLINRIATTRRVWRHRDGSQDEDIMLRRVTPIGELTEVITGAGFADVTTIGGSNTYVVARR